MIKEGNIKTVLGPTCTQQSIYLRANSVKAEIIEVPKQGTFGEDNN